MHIIIGVLTAAAGLIWALYRLQNSGVDLNAFNPFYWMRRRAWAKQLGTKPLHRLQDPMEAASVLVVAVAKLDGEITREQKTEIINLFAEEFNIQSSEANTLFASASHMLADASNLAAEIKHILAPCKDKYQAHHIESLNKMLTQIANSESGESSSQSEFLGLVKAQFTQTKSTNTW